MASLFCVDEGRLRLPREVLDHFSTSGANISRLPSSNAVDLEKSGVIVDGALHPFVATVAESLQQAEAAVTLASLFPEITMCGGWVSEGAVVLSLPTADEDVFEIAVIAQDALPRALADLIGLVPRAVEGGEIKVSAHVWEQITHRRDPSSPVADDAGEIAWLAAALKARWLIEVAHPVSGRGRRLDLAEIPGRGWCVPQPVEDEDLIRLLPVTATDIWRLLTSLLD